MRKRNIVYAVAMATYLLLEGCTAPENHESSGKQHDYLEIVKAYAETLEEHGRDTYGNENTPLFAAALDRKSLRPGLFQNINGIRNFDRCTTGANPMHDENIYQIFYALTEITGEDKYAVSAEKALKFFFENAQSSATGLLAWGEHMGWDFDTDKIYGDIHEFYRPWVLWDRCYQLAPDAVVTFARGLWDHQISNHETGEFSRHASWTSHGPGVENEYPRHGGFYIAAWAKAYSETQDSVYARAVETLVNMYDRISSVKTGAIPCSTSPPRKRIMWPESNLSLGVDLTDAAPAFPQSLRNKMLTRAAKTDEVYLSLKHDFGIKGIGFVTGADIHTLSAFTSGEWTHSMPWTTGYGKVTDAQIANLCYLRYCRLPGGAVKDAYRKLILNCANRYLTSTPDLTGTIFPGPLGDVIFHMLAANEITDDEKYLNRADTFAEIAISNFLTEDSALPLASSKHDHYEAITRGDTLMMALLKLWLARNRPDLNVELIYTDR